LPVSTRLSGLTSTVLFFDLVTFSSSELDNWSVVIFSSLRNISFFLVIVMMMSCSSASRGAFALGRSTCMPVWSTKLEESMKKMSNCNTQSMSGVILSVTMSFS
jgi:hypothetical protein